jgi:hypothetical protein
MSKVFIILIVVLLVIIGIVARLYQLNKSELSQVYRSFKATLNVQEKLLPNKMVFLHHSIGEDLLHYGGLADSLLEQGIWVKSATYGDYIGENTDINDWLPKFNKDIDKIMAFKAHPNIYCEDDDNYNSIIMFKSCFPNSNIISEGIEPGDPYGKQKTLSNYKATFLNLSGIFKEYKNHLFIYITAPPLVPEKTTRENASRAKTFNSWLVSEYLPDYYENASTRNLIVFDLFSVWTDSENYLKREYRGKVAGDSHPNKLAHKIATQEFMNQFKPLWSQWLLTRELDNH